MQEQITLFNHKRNNEALALTIQSAFNEYTPATLNPEVQITISINNMLVLKPGQHTQATMFGDTEVVYKVYFPDSKKDQYVVSMTQCQGELNFVVQHSTIDKKGIVAVSGESYLGRK